MKMSRDALLSVLKIVQPAIAESTNAVSALTNIWFTGEHVIASDSALSIRVEFRSDFTGGVLGDKLIGLLESTDIREVELQKAADDNLELFGEDDSTYAKFRLRSLATIENWAHYYLPVLKVAPFNVSVPFVKAISSLLFSVGRGKVLNPEERGVTVLQHAGYADLITTDLNTLSWIKFTGDHLLDEGGRVILPTVFCEQLCKYTDDALLMIEGQNLSLEATVTLADKKVAVVVAHGIVDDPDPIPFATVLADYNALRDQAFLIPPGTESSLDQAIVLLYEGQPVKLSVDKKDDYLSLSVEKSPYGEFDDRLYLDKSDRNKIESISVKVDGKLLRRGVEGRKNMFITNDVVVMSGPSSFLHVISAR